MSASDHKEALQTNGYTVVREALAPSEIGALRRSIARFLERGDDSRYLYNGIFKSQVFVPSPDDVFLPLLTHERLTPVLRELAGDSVTFLTEMGIAANTAAGWHKDTHGLQPFDTTSARDFGVYKVLIYPQDHLGMNEADFALKVRVGSHWMSRVEDGDEASLFIRAGDAIIMDVRLTHRGHKDLVEGKSLAARALYSPFRRYAPVATYSATSHIRRLLGRRDRYLVTLLFAKYNDHTAAYIRAGREVTKQRWPETLTTAELPSHWAERLASAGVRYIDGAELNGRGPIVDE
ncbi:MAG: phytanoyl-CoA dioxygenase family protein [Labilithrix sp.]|nr:phytanoyl-CoA dioxygenase family protein [Labilithrix sp.]